MKDQGKISLSQSFSVNGPLVSLLLFVSWHTMVYGMLLFWYCHFKVYFIIKTVVFAVFGMLLFWYCHFKVYFIIKTVVFSIFIITCTEGCQFSGIVVANEC